MKWVVWQNKGGDNISLIYYIVFNNTEGAMHVNNYFPAGKKLFELYFWDERNEAFGGSER